MDRKYIYLILILVIFCSTIFLGYVLFGNVFKNDNANQAVALDNQKELVILNPHSNPHEGEDWTVEFMTQGVSDLSIMPNDQQTLEDDEFAGLFCGSEPREPIRLNQGIIYFKEWQCDNKISKVVHFTKDAGYHTLKFQFNEQTEYAYNAEGD